MKRVTLITLMLACSAIFCLAAVSLTGNWKGLLRLNDGSEYPLSYKLNADGVKLTGSVETTLGVSPITDGVIKADSVMFNVSFNGQDFPNKGKVYPDSIGMNIIIGYDTYHITLTHPADK